MSDIKKRIRVAIKCELLRKQLTDLMSDICDITHHDCTAMNKVWDQLRNLEDKLLDEIKQ